MPKEAGDQQTRDAQAFRHGDAAIFWNLPRSHPKPAGLLMNFRFLSDCSSFKKRQMYIA